MVPRRRSVLLHSARPRRWAWLLPGRPSPRPRGFSGAPYASAAQTKSLSSSGAHTTRALAIPPALPAATACLSPLKEQESDPDETGTEVLVKIDVSQLIQVFEPTLSRIYKTKQNKNKNKGTNILVPNSIHHQSFSSLVWKN